ncbi:hypothetical protein BO79DRAFT_263719 [Aspergillus costaricaensis CBS 115574]|uniref:uncharacterized protein n=1 Tax=Aspergillus costaricaensis CBS 115574 TaxID=1448317 RepID=UPI000DBDB986|nr:hypothetical protein BO79DRAFT_263719 [Aspergillus costaricaensis CBS 115574]RAK90029.1 hypothetical protein BO79DRAFT_263719 [Aspergillus costaricaensis CBS 115574]
MSVLDFPQYTDGDVKLTIHPDGYRLHSNRLCEHSRVLRCLLGPPNEVSPLPHIQGMDNLGVYNLYLIGEAAHKFGVFQLQVSRRPMIRVPRQFTSETRGFQAVDYIPVWPMKTRRCWENIFRMFYLLPPVLHDDGPEKNFLDNSWRVVELASEIEAEDYIFPILGAALEGYEQELYYSISNDPIGWVNLAVRIQSATIFKESIIHIVGRWNYVTVEGHALLPGQIRELCERKHRDLQYDKWMIEMNILNHPVADPHDRDIYMWMAKAFYQQWLGNSIAEKKTYRSLDGGAAFYRAINAGGNAYLPITDPQTNLILLPIRQDEVTLVENRLNVLKNAVKHLVDNLLRNRSRFNPLVWGDLHYLTCCEVNQHDIPWLADRAAHEDVALMHTMNPAVPLMYRDNIQMETRQIHTPRIPQILIENPLPENNPQIVTQRLASPYSPSLEISPDRSSSQPRSELTYAVHEPDLSSDNSQSSFISPPQWDEEDDSTARTEAEHPVIPAFDDFIQTYPEMLSGGDITLVNYASPAFMSSNVNV